MEALKPVFGIAGALAAILYFGRLLYYFLDVAGSVEEAEKIGLGPTLLGLAVVGLFFCILLIVRIARFSAGLRSTGSSGRGSPDAPTHDGQGEFDADAAVARYMARRSADAASESPAAPPPHEGGGAARRPSFGRKGR